MSAGAPPPGWYADPGGSGGLRYWDGVRWSEQLQPGAAAPPPASRGTDGFAIASLVLGILGGIVLSIVFGFVARSRIKRSGKGGKGMATAGIILGFAWLALIAIGVVLAVSGVFDTSNADKFSGTKRDVATTVDDVENAFNDNDYTKLCDELFTRSFAARIAAGAKSTCPAASERNDTGGTESLDVKSITLEGQTATARVNEASKHELWRFRYEGGRWRVDNVHTL